MSSHPHEAGSDEADPEKESTPAGVVHDLEELAEHFDATTDAPPDLDRPPQ